MASSTMNASRCLEARAQARASAKPVAAPRVARTVGVASQRSAAPHMAATHISVGASGAMRAQHIVPAAAVADAPTAAASSKASVDNAKPTVIITGASSGLGLNAARELAMSGDWHVVMACRDFAKAEAAAKRLGFPKGSYTVMHLDLASFNSVRQFVENYKASGRRLDTLVCNAAVYLPTAKEPTFTADGFELSVQTNHLGHFLLVRSLLDTLKQAPNQKPKCIIVGSITGNTNTLAGNVPPKADLGDLAGLSAPTPASMIDGKEFDGAKAYKDSKVCNMLTMRELNRRYAESTGITFASLYPGCIAETGLFRSHVPVFKKLFPLFQKYVTKGYVSEQDAGKRLAQVVADPAMSKSGVYWSWNQTTNQFFENQVSEEVADDIKARKLYEVSSQILGLEA